MSQHLHEELEVGVHLDQTVRTALTGAAQLVERLARSSAERDRDVAQALHEQLLQQRLDDTAVPPRPDGQQAPPSRVEDLSPVARGYLDAAGGDGAAETATAWNAALHDLAADPTNPAAAAVAELNALSRRRHGVDLAATIAGVVSDTQANAAAVSAETAATAAAAREQAMVLLPAHRHNPDRGVSPTKATTPEEAAHRRQTWAFARGDWEAARTDLADPAARAAAWAAMPMSAKTELYWRHYDTEPARTVSTSTDNASPATLPKPGPASPRPVAAPPVEASTERGVAPSKAPNAQERVHREQAWWMAQAAHTAALPEGTDPRAARRSWEELEWPDRALRYWTAYDDPASRPLPPVGAAAVPVAAGTAAVEGLGVTRGRVVELNEQAADWFTTQASPGSKGRAYLEDRVGADVVDHGPWRLGYAPAEWTGLTDHLRAAGATEQELLAAGLGRVSSRGNRVDAFRDRATVAIRDQDGATLGFVGRDLSGADTAPKYLNTAQTLAYTKGDHLLGVHEAPAGARLVRVEGPIDAIAVTAASDGAYAGVSPLGTALTATQADTLAARSSGRVWLALDNDHAGARATEQDYWLLRDRGVDARAIPLPAGTDPAQLWREDPTMLRTLLEVAEAAPTAGVAVVDNTARNLAPGLRAGDAAAYEEFAAAVDLVAAGLPTDQDRTQFRQYAAAADQLGDQGGSYDLGGIDVEAAAAAAQRLDHAQRLAPNADQAPAATDRPTNRAGDLAATTGDQVAGRTPAYDRAATAALISDSEATEARAASAAGFSRPTGDMLADAQARISTQARPVTQPATTLGRGRAQSR